MALPSGTRLGPYEILAPLGAGGMGEVYRAADTRLNRTVAVKVLPPSVADDPDRRQRFEREARAVSSLSHPHICALYDVGRQDDVEFLVMEYVEGDTLEARLMSGPLTLDQALLYGTEIADALDHAHRRGIIHRDLKPSNIMVTPTGVKVLDFGLAKATSPDPAATMASVAGTPTRTATLTAHGMILGTLQYAAPEQLEGRAADARSDIFACGAVLHEMVTGRKAFEGTSPASLIAAVLRTEPAPLTSVQPTLPMALDRAVRKCLAKNPDDRWQTARDLMSELAWIRESGSTTTVSPPPADRRRHRHRVAWIAAGACLVAIAMVLSAVVRMRFRQATNDPSAIQFAVDAPEAATFLECNNCMALSPDGRYLAFIARSGDARELLWVRALDSVAARPLAGTDGARGPFWAPDSQTIGFQAKGKLRRVDVTGANLHTIAEQRQGLGATWNQDGIILFAPSDPDTGLSRVPAAGGAPTVVTQLDASRAEGLHTWPWFLPDGRHFIYRAWSRKEEKTGIYVGSLDSPDRTLLVAANGNPVYVAPGYLVYGTNGTLMAQPFDASSLRLSGAPAVIAQPVRYNPSSGRSAFAASERAIAYQEAANTELTWFDRQGKALGKLGAPGHYQDPALSPDGQQLAVIHVEADVGTSHLWLIDVTRGSTLPLTSGSSLERSPIWSPDGRLIVFGSKRGGTFDLYQRPFNGAGGEARPLGVQGALPLDWSRDGRFIVYTTGGTSKIEVFPLHGDPGPASPPATFEAHQGQLSPNGRWIAYASNETGQYEIYVRTFGRSEGKTLISRGGGVEPKWRRDGKELFYLAPDGRLMAADVVSNDTFTAAQPRTLFATRAQGSTAYIIGRNQYDVSADGQRFLMSVPAEGAASPITVVVNWPAALRR